MELDEAKELGTEASDTNQDTDRRHLIVSIDPENPIGGRVGPYRIDRELGRGGMGAVYLAHRDDDELKMSVCIKLMINRDISEMQDRFRRERQLLADLKHPNISMLLDAGSTQDGYPYFIMEYIEGKNIDTWCGQNQPTLAELLRLFRKILASVSFAHRKGVIHRDIKPGNIMVDVEGVPKLLDFGIAGMVSDEMEAIDESNIEDEAQIKSPDLETLNNDTALTGWGKGPMTPEYASPEQLEGGFVSEASDVYSLGLVLLQLLTGLRPGKWGCPPLATVTHLTNCTWMNVNALNPGHSGSNVEHSLGRKTGHDETASTRTFVDQRESWLARVPAQHRLQTDGKKHEVADTDAPTSSGQETSQASSHIPTSDMAKEKHAKETWGDKTVHVQKGQALLAKVLSSYDLQPVPEALGHVLRNALKENSKQRYGTALAFLNDLDRVLATMPKLAQEDHSQKSVDAVLWFHSEDRQTAMSLAEYLDSQNLAVRMGLGSYGGDSDTHEVVGDLLAQSRACIVCLGPDDHAPWQEDIAARDALAFQADDLRFFPIMLPGAVFPEKQTALPSFLRGAAWSNFSKSMHEKDLLRLAHAIENLRRTKLEQPNPTGVCPFRGLEVFREEDRSFFFGRDAATQRIYEYIGSHAFMAVLGPSGSGKSSVVQAGVIPQLRKQGHHIALFTPTSRPLDELAFQLSKFFKDQDMEQGVDILMARLAGSIEALHFMGLELCSGNADQRLFLIIDQFEEVFTLAEQSASRDRFVEAICHAVDQSGGKLSVIITMRSDFLGKCVIYADLNTLVSDHFFQVGPMSRDELACAVEEPARMAGLCLEPGLLNHILEDVEGAAGELPLMEHALMELYDRQVGGLLTLDAYNAIGGIEGALAKRAEQEFESLEEDDKVTLRKMFTMCLINPGEGAEDTRRRASREELMAVSSDKTASSQLLDRWIHARLLTASKDSMRSLEMVDVAHEALIRKWSNIGEWMAEDRETARLIGRLRQSARAWVKANRDQDYLPRGGPLESMLELLEHNSVQLGGLEREFLEAGIALRDRELQAREDAARILRERTEQAVAAEAEAIREKKAADRARLLAEQKTGEANYNLALLLDEKAGLSLKSDQPHEAWLYALAALNCEISQNKTLPGPIGRFLNPEIKDTALLWTSPSSFQASKVVFSPKGEIFAVAGRDQTIHVFSLTHGAQKEVFTGHTQAVAAMAFSPDGTRLACVTAGEIGIWGINGGPQQILGRDLGPALTLAFHPHGNFLAVGYRSGDICIWSLKLGRVENRFKAHQGEVRALEFGWNHQIVSSGTDDLLKLWQFEGSDYQCLAQEQAAAIAELSVDMMNLNIISRSEKTGICFWSLKDGTLNPHFRDERSDFLAMAANHNGLVVAADADGGLRYWDVPFGAGTPGKAKGLPPVSEVAEQMAVSQDGKWLALISARHNLTLLEMPTGKKFARIMGHTLVIRNMAISPDGSYLATASDDQTVRIWDAEEGTELAILHHGSGLMDVAISPNGRMLASCGTNMGVCIWNLETQKLVASMNTPEAPFSLAISPDSEYLAVASKNTVYLWASDSRSYVAELEEHCGLVSKVAFSPDSSILVSAGHDQLIIVWDLASRKQRRVLKEHTSPLFGLAFSSCGTLMASSSEQVIVIYETKSWTPVKTLSGHKAYIYSICFSHDSRLLASAGSDHSIHMWDLEGERQFATFEGHSDFVKSVYFSPDNKKLYSASKDKTVKMWAVPDPKHQSVVRHQGNLWAATFSKDGAYYGVTSDELAVAKLYDHQSGRLIRDFSGHQAGVTGLAFSADGSLMATGSFDQSIRVWNLENQDEPQIYHGHEGWISDVDIAPDGRWMASSSGDHTVRIWDLTAKKLVHTLTGHLAEIWQVTFSPDGKTLASASWDHSVRLWSVPDFKLIEIISNHSDGVQAVTFSPDNQLIATGSVDHSIRIREAAGGREVAVLNGHNEGVWGLAFTPDGSLLASSSQDKTVRLWDTSTWKELATLRHNAPVGKFSFNHDGTYLVTPSRDNTLYLWQVTDLLIPPSHANPQVWYQNLLNVCEAFFCYRLKGVQLNPFPKVFLQPERGHKFAEPHPLALFNQPRPQEMGMTQWLLSKIKKFMEKEPEKKGRRLKKRRK